MKRSKKLDYKFVYGYSNFGSFAKAILKLEITKSHWNQLSEQEQECISDLLGQISNAVGELKSINPDRWEC